MYKNQRGLSFISPTGLHTANRPNDAYVDDVVIGITGTKMGSPEVIKEEMQKLSNKYDKYLFASGGRLNLSKCLWYLIDFIRIKNKVSYKNDFVGDNFNLEVTEAFLNKKRTFQRLLSSQAHKSQGVFIAPDVNQMK